MSVITNNNRVMNNNNLTIDNIEKIICLIMYKAKIIHKHMLIKIINKKGIN